LSKARLSRAELEQAHWEWPIRSYADLLVFLAAAEGYEVDSIGRLVRVAQADVFEKIADMMARGLLEWVSEDLEGNNYFESVPLRWLRRSWLGMLPLPKLSLVSKRRRRPDWDAAKRWRIIARIVARDGVKCGLCGKRVDLNRVQVDHDIPLAYGGDSQLHNLQLAHGDCNLRKGGRLILRVLPPIRRSA